MSECRALTNLVGNGVATVIVSRWEKELSKEELNKNLSEPKSMADFAVEEPAAAGGQGR
jgi:aerobic C4-dicarboxylate transport protein